MKRVILSVLLNLVVIYSTLLAGTHVWKRLHPKTSPCKVTVKKGL